MISRIRFVGAWCLLIGCTATNNLCAQQIDSTDRWDLQTCIGYAKKNNILVNTYRLNEKSSQQDLLLSKAAVLPGLSASLNQELQHGKTLDPVTGKYKAGFTPGGTYGLSSSLTLYQGRYLRNDILQKSLSVESNGLTVLQQENDITLLVTQYYLNVLLDKETVKYQKAILATSIAQENQIANKLKAGSVARKDVAQLQSQVANDKYTLVTTQNTERQDLIALKQTLQLNSEIRFDIIVPDTITTQQVFSSLTDVQSQAAATRPEVKNKELGIRIAWLNLDKARSGYKPTLIASASAGTSYLGTSPAYSSQLNNSLNQEVGLTLTFPIFNRRLNKTNTEKAKIGIEQAGLDLKDTKTSLALNVEKAYTNVLNAQSQFNAAEEALKYNTETYRIANEQLRLGVTNMVEFLQQKAIYIQALQQYLQAKYNAALNMQIYNFYAGKEIKL